jgi:hypothetical protein
MYICTVACDKVSCSLPEKPLNNVIVGIHAKSNIKCTTVTVSLVYF